MVMSASKHFVHDALQYHNVRTKQAGDEFQSVEFRQKNQRTRVTDHGRHQTELTPAIREFIAGRWPQLRAQRCRNHREVLQNEIKAYFGVNFNSINYSKLRDNNLVDCQVSNKLHMQKTKEARQIARRKARLLLAEGTAQRQETALQQEMIQLDRIVSPSPDLWT